MQRGDPCAWKDPCTYGALYAQNGCRNPHRNSNSYKEVRPCKNFDPNRDLPAGSPFRLQSTVPNLLLISKCSLLFEGRLSPMPPASRPISNCLVTSARRHGLPCLEAEFAPAPGGAIRPAGPVPSEAPNGSKGSSVWRAGVLPRTAWTHYGVCRAPGGGRCPRSQRACADSLRARLLKRQETRKPAGGAPGTSWSSPIDGEGVGIMSNPVYEGVNGPQTIPEHGLCTEIELVSADGRTPTSGRSISFVGGCEPRPWSIEKAL